MTNYSYHFNTQEIQNIFLKYNLCPEQPIDYQKFVEDIHRATTVVQLFTSDASVFGQVPTYTFNNLPNIQTVQQ